MLDIKDFEGLYAITDDGKIWSYPKLNGVGFRDGHWMKQYVHRGYSYVVLTKESKQKSYIVHRLVAQTYIENPLLKKQVNHKNGNKLDNHISNLEWNTPSENSKHAYSSGLRVHIGLKGEKNPKAKLKKSDVLYIRAQIEPSKNDRKYLMKRFNIAKNTLSDILNRKSWQHI